MRQNVMLAELNLTDTKLSVSRCAKHSFAIDLPASTVLARRTCLAGKHVVFVSNSGLASGIMRGELPKSVLQQTLASHGVRVTLCGPPCNATRLEKHLRQHGEKSLHACIMIKYADPPTHRFCRQRGALTLLDNVDNHRAFDAPFLGTEGYRSVDAVLVQTREHAEWLAARKMRAIVLPHPHGNLNAWSVSTGVRHRPTGVGVLLGDAWRNQPPREDLDGIVAAGCALNVSTYIVDSPPNRGISYRLKPCPNASVSARLMREAWLRERRRGEGPPSGLLAVTSAAEGGLGMSWCRDVAAEPHACEPAHADLNASVLGGVIGAHADAPNTSAHRSGGRRANSHSLLADTTRQRSYYETRDLHELVDIGLLWKPGHQTGGPFAIRNRPPTRMNWWWSHGVPTLGYPMVAYVEGAARAGYPVGLFNVTRVVDLPAVLCSLLRPATRRCLREAALRGSTLTSPQYSAQELLAAICEIENRCPEVRRRRSRR